MQRLFVGGERRQPKLSLWRNVEKMSDIHKVTNSITRFFKRDFKKRFFVIMSFPLLFCTLHLVDFSILPAYKINDTIQSKIKITYSSTNDYGETRYTTVGYKYITENSYAFSTKKANLLGLKVHLKVSPLFKTVKSATLGTKDIKLQSGPHGVDGFLLMGIFLSILISFAYLLLKKVLTENAKLNLIYWNLFLFIIWLWIFIKFVA